MATLPHTLALTQEGFATLSTSLTRRQIFGLIFLPLISAQPLPWSGTVAFNCDAGESALIEWYVAGVGTIYADWIFLNRFAELDLRRDIAPTRGGLPMIGWFLPTRNEQLLRVRWACTIPSWVSWASCVF